MPTSVFTVDEVAAQLRVSPRTVWRRIHSGQIKSIKSGRIVRVPSDEMERLLSTEVLEASIPEVDSVATITDTERSVAAAKAAAGMGAVLEWIESAQGCADSLREFGFAEQSEWIDRTASQLEALIAAAFKSVDEQFARQ